MNFKAKGNRGELELLHLLQGVKGVVVERNQQGYIGGEGNPDLRLIVNDIPYHCEVKRTECFRPYDAFEQAAGDAVGAVPIVMHRRNRGEWMVLLTLDDWLRCCGLTKPGKKSII